VCEEAIVIKFDQSGFLSWAAGQSSTKPAIEQFYPAAVALNSPSHCPDNVSTFYLQGMRALQRGDFDPAGMMFRRTLEASLKRLSPGSTGSLYHRINELSGDLGVTPAMKEWAHAIRQLGNDAAHEEEPVDQAHAEALQGFTEMFLRYTFEMPGKLKERAETTPAD
jgi:hypothetical protein